MTDTTETETGTGTEICGEITNDGDLCQLQAGWGRDASDGPCTYHDDVTQLPRKWTHERVEGIIATLEDVPSFRYACEANDISEKTGHRWLNRVEALDENDHSEAAQRLRQFRQRVNARKGRGKVGLLSDAIEYARKHEDPDAILRIIKQIEGGDSSVDLEDGSSDLAGDHPTAEFIVIGGDDGND